MFILSLSDARAVTLATLWGEEEGISYYGSQFLPTHSYRRIEDAIAACRRDLDVGLMSIVVREGKKAELWSLLPTQMQLRAEDATNTTSSRQNTDVTGNQISGKQPESQPMQMEYQLA